MSSTYSDEDLFTTYYAATLDARQAAEMVAVHRESYPLPDATRSGDWKGTTQADRDRAALEALKRAALTQDATEQAALLDHAKGAMLATDAAVRVKR
jgi:hypothetical protein